MTRADRLAAERRGRRGESLAAIALRLKGYSILARRVRTPMGEVDLIARRARILAFVEVKARPSLDAALNAVPEGAWRRIAAAAESWAAPRAWLGDHDWRYDLVAIVPRRWPCHIRDVWRPDFAASWH